MNTGWRAFTRGAPSAPRRCAQMFIVALGVLAFVGAHRLAYLLGGVSQHHDAQVGQGYAQVGHGYLLVVELSAAVVAAASLLLFSAAVWRSGSAKEELLPFRRPLHLVGACGLAPASLFVIVEFCERSLSAPPQLVLFVGVGLQLLLGCACLLGSRRVLRVVEAVVSRMGARRPRRGPPAARRRLRAGARPRAALVPRANPCRAPPAA